MVVEAYRAVPTALLLHSTKGRIERTVCLDVFAFISQPQRMGGTSDR